MRIFYKILASLLLFSSVFIMFMMGAILTIEGINIFSPYLDTKFSPQYSPEKFDLIKLGQSAKEVETVLGKPLYHHIDSLNHKFEYDYTSDGKLRSNKKSGDFAWYRSVVYFDEAGKVIDISKHWAYD